MVRRPPTSTPPPHTTLLRSVNHAAVAILKHVLSPVWTPRKNPQLLGPPMVRICVHRVVVDPKRTVPTRQVLQPRSDVHVTAIRAILRVENDVRAGVSAP